MANKIVLIAKLWLASLCDNVSIYVCLHAYYF